MSSSFSDDFEFNLSDTEKSKTKTEKSEGPKDSVTISVMSSDFSDDESKSKVENPNNKSSNSTLKDETINDKKNKSSSSFDDDFEITESKSTINNTNNNNATGSSKGSTKSKKSSKDSFLSSASEAKSATQKPEEEKPKAENEIIQNSDKEDSLSFDSFTETETQSPAKQKDQENHESTVKPKGNKNSETSKLSSTGKSEAPKEPKRPDNDDDKPVNDNKKPEKKVEVPKMLSDSMYEVPEPLQIRPQKAKKRTPIVDDKAKDEEIQRLQELVVKQRHIIETQKETIKMLMKEQVTHEEIESLRAGLASKSPLLQLVAATPLSESRAMTQLKAENASLRRQMEDMEARHLTDLKTLRAQYAVINSRQMPTDGCANCRRRIRELEAQLKNTS